MSSIKVFIVDDNPDLVMMYREILGHYECEVIDSARDGNEAVEKFSAFGTRPDLIIMDHKMPGKCGIEAAKEILAIDKDAHIIFVSGDMHVETEAGKLGSVSFLEKPFNGANLARFICDICTRKWNVKCDRNQNV